MRNLNLFSRTIILIFLAVLIPVVNSCNERNNYEPFSCFNKDRETQLIDSVVRYMAKLPPNANQKSKFESTFDDYYSRAAKDYDLRLCYLKDSVYYLLFSRAARSITPMREAIGCKIVLKGGTFLDYEEVFRTWKMPDNILRERYPVLFENMVKGNSLEPYYAKNKGDQYIEFPDDRFYFDKKSRVWKDRIFDEVQ